MSAKSKAIEILRANGVILHATDTVIGLGCLALSSVAVARLRSIKKQDAKKSLIVLCSDREMLKRVAQVPPELEALIALSFTVPVTVIYDQVGAELNVGEEGTIAVRIPASQKLREFISELGQPMASTSANITGSPTPTTFLSVDPEINEAVDFVYDEPVKDSVHIGLASTIVRVGASGPKLVRSGAGVEDVMRLLEGLV